MKLTASGVLAIWLVCNLLFITGWDAMVLLFYPLYPTVSLMLFNWTQGYPRLALLVGIALGHIFLPLERSANPPPPHP